MTIVTMRVAIMVRDVLQLDKADYPENLRVVFCPNK